MLPQWLSQSLSFDPADFRPFFVGEARVGWLRPPFAARLAAWPDVFAIGEERVAFSPDLPDDEARSRALARVLQALREQGVFPGWRNELYALNDAGSGGELLRFERAAAKHFGFIGPASHLNGLVIRPEGLHMWIATRSASKASEPGKLDNMVAGGNPAGMDAMSCLVKECFEEAGMPAALAACAVQSGTVEFVRAVPQGVDAQRIAVFDIELPAYFVPQNQDGEVAGFELLPAPEVVRRLHEPHAFTVDAALVAWDCLKRRGLVPQE
jgi:8-oxo-dGTP pyrophosphatase MutT (NUDIX family)